MTLEQSFEKLRFLAHCARGMPFYYSQLLQREEVVLRVAAATALLDMDALQYAMLPALLPLAKYGAVRNRAMNFLISVGEYEWVDKIIAEPIKDDRQALLDSFYRAQMAGQDAEAAELARSLYLAVGSPDWLGRALLREEQIGGWRNVIAGQVEFILAVPSDPGGPYALLNTLESANEFDLVRQVVGIFQEIGAYPMECAAFNAKLALKEKNYAAAAAMLPKDTRGIVSEPLLIRYWDTLALAARGQGNFQEAFHCYQKKNEVDVPKHSRPEAFYERISSMSKVQIASGKSAAGRSDVIMALGFPRSGTTLLENALAAHPSVETFEESPCFDLAERRTKALAKNEISAREGAEIRSVYYNALLRRRRKAGASVFVDKMPIRSANAVFLRKLIPDQKYIFSIRHPYDVVLSCFFQSFKSNAAMDNFRSFAGSCRLYDFTMSQWFSVFGPGSPEVHYVRYEDLVNKFEESVTDACDFLGVAMDPSVLNFAEKSQARPVKTPSYAKVRQGVSIGVQTYWKDFGFLFESPEARCLDRWTKHFGYKT